MPQQHQPGDPALVWDQPGTVNRPRIRRETPPANAPPAPAAETPAGHRTTLREASDRFAISVGTLQRWARQGRIDAVKETRTAPHRWMVDPDSVAALAAQRATAPRAKSISESPRQTGPTEDGTAMLVPRDAWDRLIDQLGNLHEAGKALADARERAAKAETEAEFLRERLAELRADRDRLLDQAASPAPAAVAGPPPTPAMPDLPQPAGDSKTRIHVWMRRARERVRLPRNR